MADLPTDGGPTPWWATLGIDPAHAAALSTAAVAPTPDLTVPPVAPMAAPMAPSPGSVPAPEPELSFTPDDLSQSVSTARPIDPPPPLVAGASPVLAALPPADFAAVQTRLGQKQQDAAGDERQRSLDADQAKIADYERITREGNANYLKGLADNNTARDEVLKHGVQYGHLWSTRTGAQKAEMTVAGVLGGMFSSYNGGHNGAIEAYQKAVDQDIEAQKATLQANLEGLSQKQTALGQAFAATGDMAKAELTVKDEQWKTLDQRLAEAQAKVAPDGRKAVELEAARRQAAAQQAQARMALEKHTSDVAKTTAEATKAQAEALAKPREVQIEGSKAYETSRHNKAQEGIETTQAAAAAAKQQTEQVASTVPGVINTKTKQPHVFRNPAEAQQVQTLTTAKSIIDNDMDTLSALQPGGTMFGKFASDQVQQQIDSASSDIKLRLKDIYMLKRVNDHEWNAYDDEALGKYVNRYFGDQTDVPAARRNLDKHIDAELQGYAPDGATLAYRHQGMPVDIPSGALAGQSTVGDSAATAPGAPPLRPGSGD